MPGQDSRPGNCRLPRHGAHARHNHLRRQWPIGRAGTGLAGQPAQQRRVVSGPRRLETDPGGGHQRVSPSRTTGRSSTSATSRRRRAAAPSTRTRTAVSALEGGRGPQHGPARPQRHPHLPHEGGRLRPVQRRQRPPRPRASGRSCGPPWLGAVPGWRPVSSVGTSPTTGPQPVPLPPSTASDGPWCSCGCRPKSWTSSPSRSRSSPHG